MTAQLTLVQPLALAPWARPVHRGDPLFSVRIPLPPQAKKRPQSKGKIHFTPKEYDAWLENATRKLEVYANGAPAIEHLVVARVDLVYARPAKLPASVGIHNARKGRSIRVPLRDPGPGMRVPLPGRLDLDNGIGAVLDALVRADVLFDDGLVQRDGASGKWIAAAGEGEHTPCCEVRLWAVRDELG